MKCPQCGFESPPEMKYCGYCGTRLAQVCPMCDFANPLDYRYCGMCGAPLTEEPVSKRPRQPQLPFVAASALPTALPFGQLEGERRVATVILADVQSSTNLIEQIGTEAWVQVMNRVLQILEAEIYRFGGRVDQFRGDGLVAFFGATSAHEDDPERAVLAALSMQQALRSYAKELAEREGIDLKLRVGVNTGEVIITSVGDSRRYQEDTAMGEAVALASRMETAAEPDTVLVSENTFQSVEFKFKWQPLGEITVKGLSKPIAVYRPLSPRADKGWTYDLQARGILAPLTGRDTEFQTLKRCIEDLYSGRGGIVFVTGDKGMGKTFLVTQVRHHFARQEALLAGVHSGTKPSFETTSKEHHHTSVTWLHGSCRSYDQSTPFSMWSDMLRNWLEMQADQPKQDLQARLRHQAEVLWGDQLERYYPYVATLLSLPLDEALAQRVKYLNAEGLQKQFFQTICNWVEALGRQGPVVLAFNDMQWADTSSLDLLRHCLSLCDCETVLWLAIFRPDRASPVWDFRHHVEIEYPHRLTCIDMPPLTDVESGELIGQLIGQTALPDETIILVTQKAEGNPYYIREIVHTLIAQGVLVQDAETGAWRQTRSVTSLDLPGSLQSLLLARIDRFSPDERRVLQMAAVIGPLFWWNVLQALVNDTNQLRTWLTDLQRSQLIQERCHIPDLGMEYAFSSLLIRDVAYDSLLSAQRAAYHLKVAEQIEEIVGPESRKPYHSLLAYHFQRAGNRNKELFYTLGAAEEARKVYANTEALGHFSRVLELLDQMESDVQDENQRHSIRTIRFEALSGRREVYYPMGNIEAGHADSRALLPLAKQMADDPAWMVDALLAQPEVTNPNNREEVEVGLSMAQEALALAQQLGDKRRETNSLISGARCRIALQDPTWQELLEHALELTRQLGDLRMEVNLLLGIGNAYGMDQPQLSKEYLDAALSICHRLDDKATEITLLQALSPQLERKGDYVQQLTEYEQKRLALAREIGNRMEEGHALMFCGQIQSLYLGDYDGGLALMEEVVRLWEEIPSKLFPLLRIAQIQTAQGKYHEAQATLERARATGERGLLGIGHAGLGLVSAILYNALSDEAHLRIVLELASQVKQMVADNLVSRQYQMAAACELTAAHLGLARSLKDHAERQEHFSQALDSSRMALDIYNEFGFTQIVECTSQEILYRHSLALAVNDYPSEANEYLKYAYKEMMRKHSLIPAASPFRQTFLENIALHREIRAALETSQ